jgi:hypothetical protein
VPSSMRAPGQVVVDGAVQQVRQVRRQPRNRPRPQSCPPAASGRADHAPPRAGTAA